MPSRRIAVIGAGPVGLEAALYGVGLGHDVQVYERGRVGENVLRWGHVGLFSSFGINHSSLGSRTLRSASVPLPDCGQYQTGARYVESYLRPLSRAAPLAGRVRENVEVIAVGRDGIGKRDLIGGPRHEHPFRLLLSTPAGEELANADAVIDASGTFGNPNWMGSGNLPALGERALRPKIAYTIEDVAAAARELYEGRKVLVAGTGHSAASALDGLTRLRGTSVIWISNKDAEAPLPVIPEDPLPERARLSKLANELAAGKSAQVEFRKATLVDSVYEKDGGFAVSLRSKGSLETVRCDKILALVGYSPDNQIYRQLQVHECYASFGPMNLSAALVAEGAVDCLAAKPKGADVLKNPEPNFFIVGAKSYGKNSSFLIRIGIAQVREIYTLIEGRADLDLYAA